MRRRGDGRRAWRGLGAGLLAATLLPVWPVLAQSATKADRAFTIGNYPIEARAADAVAAKERAIADGQQAAFRSLLKRIVPVSAYRKLGRLKAVKSGDYIEGFSVRSERNSSTEYIASYDFVFRPEAVRQLLDREAIPFLDRQAPQITVVTAYRLPPKAGGDMPETFSETRGSDTWLYAWRGLDLGNALTPFTVATVDRKVTPESVRALADGDMGQLRTVATGHATETVVLALLEPELAERRIRVSLAGRDAVAPFSLRRTYRLDGADLAYTAELAAVISLQILEGRWKAINVRALPSEPRADVRDGLPAAPLPVERPVERLGDRPVAGGGLINIRVQFRDMGEWQRISRGLAGTPDVSDLDVQGLGGRSARVVLRYPAGPQQLAVALAQSGLILQQAEGGWVLTGR